MQKVCVCAVKCVVDNHYGNSHAMVIPQARHVCGLMQPQSKRLADARTCQLRLDHEILPAPEPAGNPFWVNDVEIIGKLDGQKPSLDQRAKSSIVRKQS